MNVPDSKACYKKKIIIVKPIVEHHPIFYSTGNASFIAELSTMIIKYRPIINNILITLT